MQVANLPPAGDPIADASGAMSSPLRRFLESLWTRFGGAQNISFTATSNTTLQFTYKGTDGIVRAGTITLS